MFPLSALLVGLLAFFFMRYFLNMWRDRHRLPDGPAPLPIIGNLGTVSFQLHPETLLKLASTYGGIYTLWLGYTPVIILNGFQAVKEVLIDHSEDFADRHMTPLMKDLIGDRHGVVFSNGTMWKQQRRLSMTILRNLGLGKKYLEDSIQHEALQLVKSIAQKKGRPVNFYDLILSSINNVISTMLFGHSFSKEDNTFHRLIKCSKVITEFSGSYWLHLYNAFQPLMAPLFPVLCKSVPALVLWKDFQKLVREEIEKHQSRRKPSTVPQDFIDLYTAQLERSEAGKKGTDDPSASDMDNMVQLVMDLFIAGSDTSTVVLYWALLYMIAYPEIQEQVQEELDTVLGPDHLICYEDRKILPFTNAVIHETQRYSSTSSLGVLHKCTRDTKVQGWPINKGTTVLTNLFSVHYDPEHWETPRKFNPGHFLDKDGNFVNREAFMPFSAGVRVCLGEKLARTSLFIMFANLLRSFRFHLPEGVKEVNSKPILGTSLQPHPYKACAIPRTTTLHSIK